MDSNFTKTNASLPEDVADRLRELRDTDKVEFQALVVALRNNNWPYRAIGDVFEVTRVAAKAWYDRARKRDDVVKRAAEITDVPSLPEKPEESRRSSKKNVIELSHEEINRIATLAEQARNVRRWTPKESPARAAAWELEELIHHYATEKQVSLTTLARHANVSRRAIAQRLEKYVATH